MRGCFAIAVFISSQLAQAAPIYSDLQARIGGAGAYGVVTLPAGTFVSSSNITIKAPITLIGAQNPDGSPATFIRRAAGANSPVALWISAGPAVIANLAIQSDQPSRPAADHTPAGVIGVIIAAPDVTLANITLDAVDTGVELWPGQTRSTLVRVRGLSGLVGDFIYCGGGAETTPHGRVTLIDCSCCDSHTEHSLRVSSIVSPSTFADLVLVGGCFANATNGKEALAFRDGSGLYAIGATFASPLPTQLGQGVPNALGAADCQGLHFFGCWFVGGPAKLRYCEQVDFSNCNVILPAGQATAISVGDASAVTVSGLAVHAPLVKAVSAPVYSPAIAATRPSAVTVSGVSVTSP